MERQGSVGVKIGSLMGVTVSWYNDNHAEVLVTMRGKCTWDELFAAFDANIALMDTVNYTVNIITDMRYIQQWPIMLSAEMRKLAINAPLSHRNSGMFIFLGTKPFFKAMFSVFSILHPHVVARCQLVDDEAQLQALLVELQSVYA